MVRGVNDVLTVSCLKVLSALSIFMHMGQWSPLHWCPVFKAEKPMHSKAADSIASEAVSAKNRFNIN